MYICIQSQCIVTRIDPRSSEQAIYKWNPNASNILPESFTSQDVSFLL